MVQIAREKMSREDDARSLMRSLYRTEADLLPDENAGTLTVRVHHQANRSADEVIRHLCTELNQTETVFPGTNLRLIYELISTWSVCALQSVCASEVAVVTASRS